MSQILSQALQEEIAKFVAELTKLTKTLREMAEADANRKLEEQEQESRSKP